MVLSRREVDLLIKTVSLTRSDELDCEGCLRELAEFAELSLEGKSIPEGLEAVEHHLAICNECQDEFQALLKALVSDVAQ